MSSKVYTYSIEFDGCRYDETFKSILRDLIASMEKSPAPYEGKVSLVVEKKDGRVVSSTRAISGLSDEQMRLFEKLEQQAHAVSQECKEPNKIKNDVEIQKD